MKTWIISIILTLILLLFFFMGGFQASNILFYIFIRGVVTLAFTVAFTILLCRTIIKILPVSTSESEEEVAGIEISLMGIRTAKKPETKKTFKEKLFTLYVLSIAIGAFILFVHIGGLTQLLSGFRESYLSRNWLPYITIAFVLAFLMSFAWIIYPLSIGIIRARYLVREGGVKDFFGALRYLYFSYKYHKSSKAYEEQGAEAFAEYHKRLYDKIKGKKNRLNEKFILLILLGDSDINSGGFEKAIEKYQAAYAIVADVDNDEIKFYIHFVLAWAYIKAEHVEEYLTHYKIMEQHMQKILLTNPEREAEFSETKNNLEAKYNELIQAN